MAISGPGVARDDVCQSVHDHRSSRSSTTRIHTESTAVWRCDHKHNAHVHHFTQGTQAQRGRSYGRHCKNAGHSRQRRRSTAILHRHPQRRSNKDARASETTGTHRQNLNAGRAGRYDDAGADARRQGTTSPGDRDRYYKEVSATQRFRLKLKGVPLQDLTMRVRPGPKGRGQTFAG